MLEIVSAYQDQIVAASLVLLTFLLNRIFRLKAKLIYSVGHSTNLVIDQPLLNDEGTQISAHQLVRTASITVENNGLLPARALEITFNWKPPFLNVWPARQYEEAAGAHNRHTLKMDSLAPGEQFTIEIMAVNAELPLLTSVRSENSVGTLIPMAPARVWPAWLNHTAGALLILGSATAVYFVIRGLQLLVGGI